MSLIIVCGFHHKIEVGKDAKKKKYFFFKSFLKSKTLAVSKNPDQLAEVSAEVSAEVVAEVSAEVSASFTEVSASFAEVSAVHSQKLPRFTQGNLQFYIVRKKCVNFVPTKIEIKRIK